MKLSGVLIGHFTPADADDPIEALTEAIIVGDDHWFRMLAITEATD
ncbi:hypothetical protein [Nocardia bovistercoris]|uniref:Uncharacterized protein n=1 Tax=Nocardia bovistercoris TaxID=2785916 RepID=A0A931N675_9NOCA|nr:hypothetical protein [Nocardia bovistercoris]MBH0780664.1 hypothetical protein [Nocardia bovistercoris]